MITNIDSRIELAAASITASVLLWLPAAGRFWSHQRTPLKAPKPLRLSALTELAQQAAGLKKEYADALALPESVARAIALGQIRHRTAMWLELANAKLRAISPEGGIGFLKPTSSSRVEQFDSWIRELNELEND